MSGNSTRLGVSLAEGDGHHAAAAVGLIACFVFGAPLGSAIAAHAGRPWRAVLLAVEAGLLIVAAATGKLWAGTAAAAFMAAATGLENAIFSTPEGGRINLTFATGTLVNVGSGLSAHVTGGARCSWLPFVLLWFGFAGGALAGALAYRSLGADVLYGATTAIAIVAAGFAIADRPRPKS